MMKQYHNVSIELRGGGTSSPVRANKTGLPLLVGSIPYIRVMSLIRAKIYRRTFIEFERRKSDAGSLGTIQKVYRASRRGTPQLN